MTEAPVSLGAVRKAEAACMRCSLYRDATQVLPGEGPVGAKFMMVGEQPGDHEDFAGRYEIDRCRWWNNLERQIVHPALVIALGATAARNLLGRIVTISKVRVADNLPAAD